MFHFYPDYEWEPTGGTWTDNTNVPNMAIIGGTPAIANDDVFALVNKYGTTAVDTSVDIVVIGTGTDGTNNLPETRWRGNNAPALNTSQALRRVPDGAEGTEDDDNIRTDSDISAENNIEIR
jgi:hypothetical protein